METKCQELTGFSLARLTAISRDGESPPLDGLSWIPASPGRAVHYDLMEAGLLENPYSSHEAAVKAQWVPQSDWVYRARFDLSRELLGCSRHFLELDCVDTFADVFVNGKLAGVCDNMFIRWRFELSGLRETGNSLLVRFKGHARMVAHKVALCEERLGPGRDPVSVRERSLVRRYQRSYGEDFAYLNQAFWGIGLVRPVRLLGVGDAFLEECEFSVRSVGLPARDTASASLRVAANVGASVEAYTARAVLTDADGRPAAEGEAALDAGAGSVALSVPSPKLWQPNGSGEAYLYTLTVHLQNAAGEDVHTLSKQVGLREVALVRKTPSGRHDFRFVVNGTPVYVKGCNTVPVDVLNAGGTPEQVETLVKLAVGAGMNMVRVWGGGTHEPDWFYSLLDRYGLMLWMDGHVHSQPYPDYDEEYVEAVRRETALMLRDLRSHPCFAVFCGGNENQEGWEAWGWRMNMDRFYGERFCDDVFPKLSAECCPEIPYVSNSPHGERLAQSPVDGDTHTWGNFYNATEDPLFITETCWYSGTISRPETLEKWMGIKAEDYEGRDWNIRWKERTTTPLWQINQYTEYHMNSGLRSYARGLELEQMTADYMALYYLRTRGPSCTGILYWPLNKGGPMMSYGCVDYDQRPLMPYYLCVRLFKPVLIHAYRDSSDIRVRAVNDGAAFRGKLALTLFDTLTGRVLGREEAEADVPYGAGHCLYTQQGWYDGLTNRRREAVHVSLTRDGALVSEDFLLFCPLFEVEAAKPKLSITAEKRGDGEWELTVTSDQYVKNLGLECGVNAMLSDNYFMMTPGQSRILKLTALEECGGQTTLHVCALDHEDDGVTVTLPFA